MVSRYLPSGLAVRQDLSCRQRLGQHAWKQDTVLAYGTEHSVGTSIRESGIPRGQIFVATKLPWNHPGRVKESNEESLANAKLDYYDLYLVHWPQTIVSGSDGKVLKKPDQSYQVVERPAFNKTWVEMEQVLASGKVRAIGLSNFSIKTIEKLLETAKVVPAVNQIELHPYLAQPELLEYCKNKGIFATAYTPTIRRVTQVILAWHVTRAVPKVQDLRKQKDNITLTTLSPEDVKRLTDLDRGQRPCCKPDDQGQMFGWTVEQLGW